MYKIIVKIADAFIHFTRNQYNIAVEIINLRQFFVGGDNMSVYPATIGDLAMLSVPGCTYDDGSRCSKFGRPAQTIEEVGINISVVVEP